MEYKITGDNLQLVTLQINPDEKIYAEAGAMIYMSANIKMESKMRGGLMKGLGRKFAGETTFLSEFTSVGGTGMVSFGGPAPGSIKLINVSPQREFIIQKDAFLVAQDSVDMSVVFQKRIGAAFFGGEGFILEKLSGNGTAFIHGCGDFVEFDLKEGQILKVDTSMVVGWDSTVDYDIERVKGVKTMFFGGEGLFLATLKGPGKVLIQSMSLYTLASAIMRGVPKR